MGDDGSVGRGAASPGAGVDPPRQGAPVTQSLDRSATEAAGLRGGAAGWTAGQTGWAATGDHHPHRHGNQPSLFSRRSEGTDAYLGPAHGGDPHTAGEEPGPLDSSTPEGFFSPGWSNFLHSTENSKHTFLSNQILYGINPSQISANFSANETYMDVSLWINESNYYGNVTAADGATGGGGNGSAGGGGGAGADGAALGLLGDISLGFILGLLCMATFVGNAMVLHAVRTEKRLQTVSNMFIVSLAIADLVVGLVVMPISAIYIFTQDWHFGLVVCQLWIGVDYTASTASILNLFILSLDRYWSVTSPLKYLRRRTKKRALIMIFLVWFVSSLWVIPIIGWHHFEHGGVRTVPPNVCDTEYAQNTILKIITGILNYYLPLAIMYALYTKIFIEIRKRSKFELGQRTCGGGVTANGGGTQAMQTSSMTEESCEPPGPGRNCYGPEPQGSAGGGAADSNPSETDERKRFLNPNLSRLTTTSEGETETSEDEHTRLHKGKYTNLRLLRANQDSSAIDSDNTTDMPNSDIEIRVEYFYDEAVVDSSTERVHRFYDEQHSREKHRTRNAFVETAETSLTIPNKGASSSGGALKPLSTAKQGKKHVYFAKYQSKKRKELKGPNRKFFLGRSGKSDARGAPHIKVKNRLPLQQDDTGSHAGGAEGSRDTNLTIKARRFREKLVKHNIKNKSPSLAREIKAAKQLGVIMGAFTICFCPYFVLFMVIAFCELCVPLDLMTAMTWVGYLNSTLNPILYPLCNLHFRRKFKRMLRLEKEQDQSGQVLYSRYYMHRHSQTEATNKYDY